MVKAILTMYTDYAWINGATEGEKVLQELAEEIKEKIDLSKYPGVYGPFVEQEGQTPPTQ